MVPGILAEVIAHGFSNGWEQTPVWHMLSKSNVFIDYSGTVFNRQVYMDLKLKRKVREGVIDLGVIRKYFGNWSQVSG